MKSFVAVIAVLFVGMHANAKTELTCEGSGTFAKTNKVADVKVTVESHEGRCLVEIKVGDAVAPRGWIVICPDDGSFVDQIVEPSNRDFLLDLGTPSSLKVFYRSGNDFETSQLDCK